MSNSPSGTATAPAIKTVADPLSTPTPHTNRASGRLSSRPETSARWGDEAAPLFPRMASGLHPLDLGIERDGYIYIPERVAQVDTEALRPAPLLVLLHGAGGESLGMLPTFKDLAEETGTVLLLPDSRKRTWDMIRGGFGEDLEFLDRALERIFSLIPVQHRRIAIGGFSDGASYALSVGLPNGSLFTHILAFSPGFVAPFEIDSTPLVFVSHGTDDRVLQVERCSRRIVPHLQRMGFDVQFTEFQGGHGIPDAVAREAIGWFMNTQPISRR